MSARRFDVSSALSSAHGATLRPHVAPTARAPIRSAVLLALWLGAAMTAQAQTGTGVPPMKGEGAARYVCGGIGTDESVPMRAAMKDHPLSLRFAQADGSYTADLDVVIKDAKGKQALTLRSTGPICLVDLPAGRYTIEAIDTGGGGARKSQTVTLGGAPKTAEFRF